jgi:hypothetical protein
VCGQRREKLTGIVSDGSRNVSDMSQEAESAVALWWNGSVKTDIKILGGY